MLTDAQLATLKAHIEANTDPEVVAALSIRNDTKMAELYNLDSSFVVWKTTIEPEDYRGVIDWAEFEALPQGKINVWNEIGKDKPINPMKANIRQGFQAIFGSSPNTRNALVALAKRNASVYESVFATGDGTNGSPGDLVVVGPVNIQIIGRALNG